MLKSTHESLVTHTTLRLARNHIRLHKQQQPYPVICHCGCRRRRSGDLLRQEDHLMPVADEFPVDEMPDCSMGVQKLYNACKVTFTPSCGGVFPAQALVRVQAILDSIKASDVGLDENAPIQHNQNASFLGRINGRKGKVSPPISYLHLYECEDFSMGIFCLPSSAVIPLHNHPGMTVLSKLLYGSMHVKAYDWVDNANLSHPMLAKLAVDRVMSAPCKSTVLYPKSGGNMHVFTAITPCAVLDVLAPPYSSEDGRHCTYYRAFPFASHAGRGLTEEQKEELCVHDLVWMEEFQPPSDFVVKQALYKGPAIIP